MKKITKREFIDRLSSAPHMPWSCDVVPFDNGLAIVRDDGLEEHLAKIDRATIAGYDLRTVSARRSNHLVFSDGSRLYFDSFAERTYYADGSALAVVIHEKCASMMKILCYKVEESA